MLRLLVLAPVVLIFVALSQYNGVPTLHHSGFGTAKHVIIFGCDGFGILKNVLRVYDN